MKVAVKDTAGSVALLCAGLLGAGACAGGAPAPCSACAPHSHPSTHHKLAICGGPDKKKSSIYPSRVNKHSSRNMCDCSPSCP